MTDRKTFNQIKESLRSVWTSLSMLQKNFPDRTISFNDIYSKKRLNLNEINDFLSPFGTNFILINCCSRLQKLRNTNDKTIRDILELDEDDLLFSDTTISNLSNISSKPLVLKSKVPWKQNALEAVDSDPEMFSVFLYEFRQKDEDDEEDKNVFIKRKEKIRGLIRTISSGKIPRDMKFRNFLISLCSTVNPDEEEYCSQEVNALAPEELFSIKYISINFDVDEGICVFSYLFIKIKFSHKIAIHSYGVQIFFSYYCWETSSNETHSRKIQNFDFENPFFKSEVQQVSCVSSKLKNFSSVNALV